MSGNMMYGPGCCAHAVSGAQIEAAKRRAREEGRGYRATYHDDSGVTLVDIGGV